MKKIHSGQPGTDVEFLEFTLQNLHVHMAKARIHERHQEMLQYRLKKIKEEQMLEMDKHQGKPERIKKEVLFVITTFSNTFLHTFQNSVSVIFLELEKSMYFGY